MRTLALLAALLGTTAATCDTTSAAPQVQLADGIIEGICITNDPVEVNAFMSVPWGTPPLGELRYEKPVKVQPWTGVKSTKVQPPRCAQSMTSDPNSEDCLYLNVFAPAQRRGSNYDGEYHGKGYPVIVEIHGGAFQESGARANGDIGMARLLAGKGTVVVSIQYRVGPLGFFTTGDSVMPGNMGMFDVVMQLEWVRDNIHAFGGDPDSVTLHGGSAAAGIIDACSFSPKCWPLFHKAWAVSGGSGQLGTSNITASSLAQAAAAGYTWTSSADLKAQLKAATNITGMLTGWAIYTDVTSVLVSDYSPVYDGDFFPPGTDQVQMRLNAPIKPRVMGDAFLEGAGFTGYMNLTEDLYTRVLEYMVPEAVPNRTAWLALLRADYDERAAVLEPTAQLKHKCQQIAGERLIVPVVKDVSDRLLAIGNGEQDSWFYIFNYMNPAAYGSSYPYVSYASHVLDVTYTIGIGGWTYNDDDWIMMEWMSRALTNFAKTGNPNTPNPLPTYWERQTNEHNDRHLQWTMTPFMDEQFMGGRIKINNDFAHQYGVYPPL